MQRESSNHHPSTAPDPRPAGAIVLGASAGAVSALSVILAPVPRGFPLPFLIVVHLPRQIESGLTDLFAERCRLKVKEAEDKERIEPGTVYFAPTDYHLLVERDFRLSLCVDEPVLYSRPSIDVLFQSAADAYGPALTGVILTGANSDGAEGLRAVCAAGGLGVVQDPATAEAPAMPLAALGACPGARCLGLEDIAGLVLHGIPADRRRASAVTTLRTF